MSPPLQITEDTPPDMLAGSMDLCVVLPNGKDVRMSVERSTPMMDLLVQVTTANKISPAGHVIQAIGERGVMPYKPSTPIGALDTWTIYIVPKNQVGQIAGRKGYYKSVNQPFEQTFRLQVHLPRNQLYVSRISPKTRVSEILRQVCSEKNLDPSKYSLRHPVNLDQVLAGSCSLADYKLQEVALVSNRSRPVSGVSTVDIMALQQQRPVHATANHRSCEGSLSSGSLGGRSLSPTRSDESSASPPPLVPPVPHRPLRKRRPAPKPPVNNNNNNNLNNTVNNVVEKNNNNNINSNPAVEASQPSQGATVICHSRNSSDSSGYHEASVLSESPESTNNSLPDSLPRRSKLPSNESNLESTSNVKSGGALSRSLSNLTTAVNSAVPRSIKTHSTSSTSLIAIGRKKKAAPAPPMARPLKMSSVSEERQKDISSPQSPLDDTSRKSSTLPATLRSTLHPQHSDVGSSSSSVCTPDTVDDLPAPSHLCPSFDLLQNTPSGDEEKSKLADWRNSGSVGLQSLQVLRSILPQLNNSHDSINGDNDDYIDNRNPDIRVASDLHDKFERSHSEEVSSSERYALHAAPAPAVSFATWNERPKRQVSIKTDRDYCYGINKLKSHAFDQRDTTEPKQSVVNFSSDMRHNDLDKPDIIKHSSADLSHVPVVRAVELKKKPYFSSSCVDVTDLGRCGFFHGRSYENLSCLDNSATFSKSSTLKPTAVSSKESFKSQQSVSTEEEASSYSGVNSLLRKFGQQKPTSTNRPVSCYLYGSGAYNNNKLEENSVPRQTTGNTSRVMLNSDKRFTSVVGINNDEAGSNSVPRKEFTSQYEKPTSRVMVNGTSHNDDRFVNNSKEVKNAVNSSLEFIKAQSKISSGGFVLESPTRKIETDIPVAQSTTSPPPTAVPAKSILKPSKVNKPQSSGGIPPPPPVMPTLKPVGERRQTRTLPRVETDPRDQLLESIRNFGGLKSLKKSSSK